MSIEDALVMSSMSSKRLTRTVVRQTCRETNSADILSCRDERGRSSDPREQNRTIGTRTPALPTHLRRRSYSAFGALSAK